MEDDYGYDWGYEAEEFYAEAELAFWDEPDFY